MMTTKILYRSIGNFTSKLPASSKDEGQYTYLIFRRTHHSTPTQDGEKMLGLYKLALVFLGLLFTFLLGVIILGIMITEDGQQLQDCYISQATINASAQEREELHRHLTNSEKEKSQIRYDQLYDEKVLLEANCSATSDERDELRIRFVKLVSMKKIKQHSVNVILDPNTAHPYLFLSADGKQVRLGDKQQQYKSYSKRFNSVPCVLGKEGFSGRKFYYEVQVSQKMCWDIGVVRESINRWGHINYKSENGFWLVIMRENGYFATKSYAAPLSLKQRPQRVGVFVDYKGGLVSFYDADSWYHIHSFTEISFTEKLYPFLGTCAVFNQGSLTITTPVKRHC